MDTEIFITRLYGNAIVNYISDGDPIDTVEMMDGDDSEYQVIEVIPSPYSGDYTVVPKAHEEVVLETAHKTMVEDVIVTQIPYYETSNVSGGLTIYIADEV